MAVALPFSAAAAAAALIVVILAARAVLAVIRFRRYELAIPGPPSLPFFGNAFSILCRKHEDILDAIMSLWGQRRDLSRCSFIHELIVFVSKPEDVADVMKRKDLQDKSHFYYGLLADQVPQSVLVLNGAEMKVHRAAAHPAFHPEIIDSFVEVFAEEAEKFVRNIEQGKEITPQEKLFLTTAWGFCRSTVISDTPTKDEAYEISNLVKLMRMFLKATNERAFNPLLWPRWIFNLTANGRLFKKERPRARAFIQKVMNDRAIELKRRLETEGTDFVKARKSLLDVFLEKSAQGEELFSRDAILDEVLLYLAAATETTVSALNFAFKMLSIRPDIQMNVYEEVSSLLGRGATKRSIVAQDLPKLQYTEKFLKEVMRMFATIPLIARQINEDTELGGHVLPKGATVFVNFLGLHRDPVTWPDPLRFDPERFSPEQSQGRHPYAFVPFSGGVRSCIGYKYGWAVMKTVIATTVRDFIVEPGDDGLTDHTKFKLVFDIALKLAGGVKVKLIPRDPRAGSAG
ncbi:Cytochrome P450 4C1 [Frankliniella fusca]|uniref:Cytochrome P450 4C1 n=1 Tax=Frankliniella fusca TaxID=407009 RepID=A0AAE1HZC8_9NEOP|nr:Cytochrome P450 4C1 [Frankliniella fusca]